MLASRLLLLICGTSLLQFICPWAPRHSTHYLIPPTGRVPLSGPLRLAKMAAADFPYPRAAVSVAVRCEYQEEAYYLLIQRGKDPNRGRWSFPGGKLEMGETAMQGGKRELLEETEFVGQYTLRWFPETIATHDSLSVTNDGIDYHFLIAVCFAELKHVRALPKVTAMDDAANARWWRIKDLVEENIDMTPGLVERIGRTEFLYQREVFL